MAKRIKIRKKQNKNWQHKNNHWNGYSTDEKGSQFEVPKSGWSPRLLAENFSSITWQNWNRNGSHMDIPKWMTTGKTRLRQKDPGKGNAVDNYRLILCLPFMLKLITGVIANSVYGYLDLHNLIPVEQKGSRRNIRGTKDQLLIDKMVLIKW